MMSFFRGKFISGLSISKFPLGGQSQLGKKPKGPINGDITNLGIDFGDQGVNLVKVLMTF
jgi:hypothetical protein